MGTPQSLDDLTRQITLVPMNQFMERVPAMIRDYLSQGFGAAMLAADSDESKRLEQLFNHLARRKTDAR